MTALLIIVTVALLIAFVYTIVISVFTYGWIRLNETAHHPRYGETKVSVIVPFRDEACNLPVLLQCLHHQSYPASLLEIILVDDHSEDKGRDIINDFISTHQASNFKILCLYDGEGISKKAALRKGIGNSNGELILTTDADCNMGINWISAMVGKYLSENCQMISGPVCIRPDKSVFSKLQTLEFFSLIGSGAGAIAIGRPFLANGANLAFSRSLYNELQGYSSHIGYASGDDVFMLLQAKKKHRISFLKDKAAIVFTQPAANLKNFFHQRIRWASKSAGYKDTLATITAMSVFLISFFIFATLLMGFLNLNFLFVAMGLFILKIAVDFLMFCSVSGFFRFRKLMWFYLPMQLFYTIYIIGTAILSWLIPFEWKNRSMRK